MFLFVCSVLCIGTHVTLLKSLSHRTSAERCASKVCSLMLYIQSSMRQTKTKRNSPLPPPHNRKQNKSMIIVSHNHDHRAHHDNHDHYDYHDHHDHRDHHDHHDYHDYDYSDDGRW